jgi:hypothetical protein
VKNDLGHPSSRGWTTLQTVRTEACTKTLAARYREGQLWISTWSWDTAAANRGLDVDWQMQLELKLDHNAVITLGRVYSDGLHDHVQSLKGARHEH